MYSKAPRLSWKKRRRKLLLVKAKHKKVAGEFIELWVKVRRMKKQINSTLI